MFNGPFSNIKSQKSEGWMLCKDYEYTHTQPFNGPLSGTTRVSRYQKGKTNLDFTEARDSEWQWNPLCHMQVCTSFQTDNHASTPLLSFFTGRMPYLPPNQQCQSTEGKKDYEYISWKNHRTRPLTLALITLITLVNRQKINIWTQICNTETA